MRIARLCPGDETLAGEMFLMMAEVFDEPRVPLGADYVAKILADESFWALMAAVDGKVVGGLTGHTLHLTRVPSAEVLIYDLAVAQTYRRQGVATALVSSLRAAARAANLAGVWVPADVEDDEALAFYRAAGGTEAPVSIFTFDESAAPP